MKRCCVSTMLPCLLLGLMPDLAACGGSHASESDAAAGESVGLSAVELDLPANGFQLRAEIREVDANEDVQWCEVLAMPGDPDEVYYIEAFDIALSPGSHHANLMAVIPGSAADSSTVVGDVSPCLVNGVEPYGDGLHAVTTAAGLLTENRFPDGVGIVARGGDKVVFNIHYVNTRETGVPGAMVVNVHLTDEASVQKELQRFAFYNSGISIPPGAETYFDMECAFSQDVEIHELLRHTHSLGTDFTAEFAGGDRDGEQILLSESWSDGVFFPQDPPLQIKAGDGLRFRCNYINSTDHSVAYGELGSDEMCILYGRWTVADPAETPTHQNCANTFTLPRNLAVGFPCSTEVCP